METLVYFILLCILAASLFAALAINRRLMSQDIPEEIITLAILHKTENLTSQLEALAAQLHWTDSELIRTVWLVDCSPDGSMQPECTAFCRSHSSFRYIRQSELVNTFGKMTDSEKNDCNLTKKRV